MKRIVSISLGSSQRDHYAEVYILGEKFIIERIGTNGDLQKAIHLIEGLDGKVDAIGMGGIDLYLWAGEKKYIIRQAIPLKRAARKTPIVDGSGLKNTLEKRVIYNLQKDKIIDFQNKEILVPSAMDRFGLAKALEDCGAQLTIGDLIFALGINVPVYSLTSLHRIASIIAPVACRLPFKFLYPTGKEQQDSKENKLVSLYHHHEIIAGDFHYIKRYMPNKMTNKTIITNTVTAKDIEDLKSRDVRLLITTTPELEGRSFGTNVMEGVIISILRMRGLEGTVDHYEDLLNELDFNPRIEYLTKEKKEYYK